MNLLAGFLDIQPEYDKDNEESVIAYLEKCNMAYYTEGGIPIISDAEYDIIFDTAKEKWPLNDMFKHVGSDVKGKKVKHDYILGSLEKYKVDSIQKWFEKLKYNGEIISLPKFDGISAFLEVNNGSLVKATTRGNGEYGKDITEKVKCFFPYLENITCKLRGEILLPGYLHEELGMANRRNATSGIIGRKDIDSEKLKLLTIVLYEIIDSDEDIHSDIKILTDINRKVSGINFDESIFKFNNLRQLGNNTNILIETLEKTKLYFKDFCDIDGLVLISNSEDIPYERQNTYIPSNKISFKNTDESAIVVVKEIVWSTSRNGRVIPVVHFCEPYAVFGGASIRKASGYNANFIIENKIVPGTKVEIQRSNDVIPKIVAVLN